MKSVCKLLSLASLMLLIATGAWAQLPGDVVINEIMYDDVNSTDLEWVELHNTTGSSIDLSDWVLIDDSVYPADGGEGAIQIPFGTSISANGYLVICRVDLPDLTGEVLCTHLTTSWTLGNGGDNLALYTAATGGTLIDGSLTEQYPDINGAAGTSIEKCDESAPWTGAEWHASLNEYSTTGSYLFCTPGAPNTTCADLTPPELSYVWVNSLTQIDVRFTEDVDQTTAETVTNYIVDNGVGSPLTATRDGSDLRIVHLTFNTLANNAYTVTVSNVEDLNSNVMIPEARPFIINNTAANAGDVVISEVMYDDTGSTDVEWVEIYNTTGSAINVSGWLLTDATDYPATIEGVIQIPFGATISAGQYMVLAREATPGIGSTIVCNEVYGAFALNNGGDNLALYHAVGGQLIYGSLADVYPDLSGLNSGNSIEVCLNSLGDDWATLNWYESEAVFTTTDRYRNCTPGSAPSICVIDETPPSIVSVTALSGAAVDVLFDEDLDQTTAETAANYVVTPGSVVPATATLDGANFALVHLTFAPALAVDNYTLTVNGVEDLSGNATVNETGNFSVSPATGGPGDVVITEVMYDDTASGDVEWVEIYNTTASAIDISGWLLTDDDVYPPNGEGYLTMPAGTIIGAGAYVVVGEDSALVALLGSAVIGVQTDNWALSNTGDNLAILTSDGATLIHGSFTTSFPDLTATSEGNTVEVCLGSVGMDWDLMEWYEADEVYSATGRYRHCTPGTAPHICGADTDPPVVVSASLATPSQLDVFFNEMVDTVSAETATNYNVDNGVGNPLSAELLTGGESVRLTFSAVFAPNTYIVTVTNVEDLAENVIAGSNTAQFTVGDVDNIVITEIMPNPNFAGTADSLGEWIEIYNNEAAAIDLSGWIISDNNGSDTIEGPAMVGAGDYFVFCSNGNIATNGGVPTDFAYHFALSGWGMALNNSGELLTLRNSAGDIVTSVNYTGLPFSAGISCQLRDVTYNPAIDTNWCAGSTVWPGATNGDLGTPGEATVCAGPQTPDTLSICDLRVQDVCGIPDHDNDYVYVRGVVTHVDTCRNNVYIEDNGCAVLIFGNDATEGNMQGNTRPPLVGDSIAVEGNLDAFNGVTEFSPFTVYPALITWLGSAVVPVELTLSPSVVDFHLDDCSVETYESRHIVLEDMSFIDGDGVTTFAGNTVYYAVNGIDTVAFYVNNCDTIIGDLIPTEIVHLHGVGGQFDNDGCYCGGYQIVTGRVYPFASAQVACTVPASATNYFNSLTGNVEVRWTPGLGQLCNCYSIFYADVPNPSFPGDFFFLDCACGVTEYTDTNALNAFRIYVVVAQESCGP